MFINQSVYHPLVPAIFAYAREKGINNEFLSKLFQRDILPNDSRALLLTPDQLLQMGRIIFEICEDSNPGLNIGKRLHWPNLGIVGHIVVNSRNVLDGMRKFQSYYHLVSNITAFNITVRPDEFELAWKPLDGKIKLHHRLIFEGILACIYPLLKEQTGQSIRAREIHCCGPAPKDLSLYEQAFQTRLSFNHDHIKAVFERSIGELPCQLPNAEMLAVLEEYVRKRCYSSHSEHPQSREVLNALGKCKYEIPSIEQVADTLGISIRNLQLKLKKEGTTFRSLREQSLCQQACMLLEKSADSVEVISSHLGFSEPAVFYRNFKRWTGKTPKQYRISTRG